MANSFQQSASFERYDTGDFVELVANSYDSELSNLKKLAAKVSFRMRVQIALSNGVLLETDKARHRRSRGALHDPTLRRESRVSAKIGTT